MKAKGGVKTNDYILAIDVGTQSIRAILIDPSGTLHDIVKTPIEPYYSEQPGWAEQDPDYYWKTLCQTCKKLLASTKIRKESIRGVTTARRPRHRRPRGQHTEQPEGRYILHL